MERREGHVWAKDASISVSAGSMQTPPRRNSSLSIGQVQEDGLSGFRGSTVPALLTLGSYDTVTREDGGGDQYLDTEMIPQESNPCSSDLGQSLMSSCMDGFLGNDALPDFDFFATYGDWMSTDAL